MSRRRDVLELLEADHRETRALLRAYRQQRDGGAGEAGEPALAERVWRAAGAHAELDTALFYPALCAVVDDAVLMAELEAAHAQSRALIARMRGMQPADPAYDTTLAELADAFMRHAHAEEGGVFDKARRSDVDLMLLADRLNRARHALPAQPRRPDAGQARRRQVPA